MMIIQSQCSMSISPLHGYVWFQNAPVHSPTARQDFTSPLAQLSKHACRNRKGCDVGMGARANPGRRGAREHAGARAIAG
jgi:hypothetical protein